MNVKLTLSFDGTYFYGWQVQPNKRTVAGELIKALKNFVDGDFKVIGCGRTDAGVHALNYVANVRISGRLRVEVGELKYKLNKLLPDDIYVKRVETVNEDFHARFSAKSKVYRYVFLKGYNPLLRNRVYFIDYDLSVEKIEKSLKVFIGKHNFGGFSSDERDNRVCTIYGISLSRVENLFYFEVEGDRFLRKMVRFMAGAVLMLAEGKITEGDITMSLHTGKKIKNLTPLPPYALYLLWVKY